MQIGVSSVVHWFNSTGLIHPGKLNADQTPPYVKIQEESTLYGSAGTCFRRMDATRKILRTAPAPAKH